MRVRLCRAEIDEALDHLDEVKAALIAQEGPVEAWESSSETASIASSTSTMPSSASTMGVKPSVPMTKAESKRGHPGPLGPRKTRSGSRRVLPQAPL